MNSHDIDTYILGLLYIISFNYVLYQIFMELQLPYARNYKPRLVFLYTHFSLRLRLIASDNLCTKQGNVGLKSAAYKRERLQNKIGLWWHAYGMYFVKLRISSGGVWLLRHFKIYLSSFEKTGPSQLPIESKEMSQKW